MHARTWTARAAAVLGVAALGAATAAAPQAAADQPFLSSLHQNTTLASTVPANGDVNPYGVAVVPRTVGRLHRGDALISNFNDKRNLQGTGTTIVAVSPSGRRSVFATITPGGLPGRCPGGIGLTTALVALRSGWVVVGSLPTTDGMAATAKAGCLLALDASGRVRQTVAGPPVAGPWDMTAVDGGATATLFVSNVLNGTVAAAGKVVNHGTVARIRLTGLTGGHPRVASETVIGSGFGERSDPAALVVGPTGLALGGDGTLYVADTVNNRISAIRHAMTRGRSAGTGRVVTANGALNAPLGLTLAPAGHLLAVNADDGRIVEVTPAGAQVASRFLDRSGSPPGAGALFGLALTPGGNGVYYVDDATNELRLLH